MDIERLVNESEHAAETALQRESNAAISLLARSVSETERQQALFIAEETNLSTSRFIRNCWYVVAWEHEIAADALFSRTVIGEPLLLFRTSDGAVVALEDRCCHRLAPLSKGRKEGDCVRCGYHGLKFDAGGQCVEVPGLDSVPPEARVRSVSLPPL